MRCPSCSHANEPDFRFCQRCGYKRKTTVLPNHGSLNSESLQTIDERLHQLTLFSEATSYSKQKASLQKELESFLGSLPGRPSLTSVTPQDICRFLVLRIGMGGLKSTKMDAIFLDRRLSYKTVDSYIGKLRAIFRAISRTGGMGSETRLRKPSYGQVG